MDEFKKIDGFDNYIIYRNGNVQNTKTKRILKFELVSKGYPMVQLCKAGKCTHFYIHRLLAIYFIPNPHNKKYVNHINGLMSDNRLQNLEWSTPKENIQHAYRIGLCPTKIKALQASKLTEEKVFEIREKLRIGISRIDLSKEYNVHSESIRYIQTRRTWNHI